MIVSDIDDHLPVHLKAYIRTADDTSVTIAGQQIIDASESGWYIIELVISVIIDKTADIHYSPREAIK